MTLLRLDRITHAYFGRTILDAVSLQISQGEMVALVGPSGCGKSTLVHIAAGLVEPQQGRVVRNYKCHGMVFQEHRLLPWATTRDNIAFPLRLSGISPVERNRRALAAARTVSLDERDTEKFPIELSGGMRQRAAIARALVVEPDFLFFDEPFTALDVALKRQMQDIVVHASEKKRFSGLFVTHDLSEAIRMADRIIVMDERIRGIAGERTVPLARSGRSDEAVFALMQSYLKEDPLFGHVYDVNERAA